MSPLLYLRFWSLSLSDIYVPKARYLAEIEKVQKAAKDAAKEAESLTGSDQKKRDREAKFLRVRSPFFLFAGSLDFSRLVVWILVWGAICEAKLHRLASFFHAGFHRIDYVSLLTSRSSGALLQSRVVKRGWAGFAFFPLRLVIA